MLETVRKETRLQELRKREVTCLDIISVSSNEQTRRNAEEELENIRLEIYKIKAGAG
jgi:hypothetical protein